MWKFWVAAALFLFERGLDLSGFQSLYLSVVLWFFSAIFFVVALREYVSERSSNSILPKTKSNVFKKQLHEALELDKKHRELKEEVKELKTSVDSLLPPKQRAVAVLELSKSPGGEVLVASDMTAVSKDHNVEIRSILEEAGWKAKARYLDEGEAPDGITVSGSASGLVSDAFKQADVYMKEDPTNKTGPTYIVVGFMKDKKKNKQ